jgi:hypothetical protein
MREVVDRRPADIHADVSGIERPEVFLLAGQRVVKSKHDRISLFGVRPALRFA